MAYMFECGDDAFMVRAHSEDEVLDMVRTHVEHHDDEQHQNTDEDQIREQITEADE